MNHATDIDNRDKDEIIQYLESRVEVLQRVNKELTERVEELAGQNKLLCAAFLPKLDPNANLGACRD